MFRETGIPGRAALAGGLFFLVHPANVEAVAWASQLKTLAALSLSLLALLGLRRWPPAALSLFALALLAKASALAALPMAAAANSDKAEDLAKIEASGLAGAGKSRLKSLVETAEVPEGDVQFSRSWIDAQPKASGSAERLVTTRFTDRL